MAKDFALKLLYAIGVALAVWGSFLPWWGEGDFGYYLTPGVAIEVNFGNLEAWLGGWLDRFPIRIEDHGGLLMIGLSAIVAALVFYRPRLIKQPQAVVLACAAAVLLLATYHFAVVLWRHAQNGDSPWGPDPQNGLAMVALGGLFLLYAGISDYRKRRKAEFAPRRARDSF